MVLAEYHQIRQDPESFLTAPGPELEGTELVEETQTYAIRIWRTNGHKRRFGR